MGDDIAGTVTADWASVLAHRPDPTAREAARARFEAQGVSAELVAANLADTGETLFRDISSGRPDWAVPYGGLLAAALIAGEVAIYSSVLVARASSVRAVAVDALLEDFSAISVAASLGVSRQKVYEIARGGEKLRQSLARERA